MNLYKEDMKKIIGDLLYVCIHQNIIIFIKICQIFIFIERKIIQKKEMMALVLIYIKNLIELKILISVI